MQAIILAGGKGTRIASVRSDVPKPMIEVRGKPILQYQIENLRACGITEITIGIGHLGDAIKNFFGDGKKFGVSIKYFSEEKPLGTAGAIFRMLDENLLEENFLLLCGDIIFDVDFSRILKFHSEKNAWATLVSHPNSHPYDSSILMTETLPPKEKGGLPIRTGRVVEWLSKEDERGFCGNLVNAGIQVISREMISAVKKMRAENPSLIRHPENPEKIDLDRDVLKTAIPCGKIFAYQTSEYIKDMGTPDRYREVEADIASGKVAARNLARKQKAIFFDRDGTLTREAGFVTRPEMLELSEGAGEAVRLVNDSGFLAILVTNQPAIARGDLDFEGLSKINGKLETLLGKEGAFLDAIYFCPHHTDKGFPGERSEYKFDCECRKPKAGMLFRAAEDFNIDLSKSFMIGDSGRDEGCAKNGGLKKSILVGGGKSVLDAVKEILSLGENGN